MGELQLEPADPFGWLTAETTLRYVLAWAEMYTDELEENWRLIQMGKQPIPIPGL